VAAESDAPEVFLDGDIDEGDDVAWLEDEDQIAAGSGALPARTTRARVVGSLLLVGAVLAATGYGANAVDQRDRAADLGNAAAADELVLAAPASRGISLPGLGDLGSAAARTGRLRTERLSTEIAVPLVNRGPAAITLLPGATLLGPGLTAADLGDATIVLAPGQSTVLRGRVTVDCGRDDNGTGTGTKAVTSLMVSARTSGGGLGVSTVAFDAAAGSVRDRVCAVRDGA